MRRQLTVLAALVIAFAMAASVVLLLTVTVDAGEPEVTTGVVFTDNSGFFSDSGQTLGSASSNAVALGDVDGDGDLDALVANFDAPHALWINQGGTQGGSPGIFQDSGQTLGSGFGTDVQLGDLDRDGDLDAYVLIDSFNDSNQVFINQGGDQGGTEGVFQSSGQVFGDDLSSAVALGDVNGDSDLDAFVTRSLGRGDKVWTGGGNGLFVDTMQSLGSDGGVDLALGDVDGDNDLDAFIVNGADNRLWTNQGGAQAGAEGIFLDSGRVLTSGLSLGVVLTDVDGDLDLDAFVANSLMDKLWINQGGSQGGTEGVFQDSGQNLSAGEQSRDVALGDVDGDGDLDAVIAKSGANELWVNQGGSQGGSEGVFLDSGESLGSGASESLALGDLDGDGDLDIFVANWGEPNRVWLNGTVSPTPPSIPKGWRHQILDTRGDGGKFNSLVVDQNGHPHISYVRFISVASGFHDTLWYAHWDGVRWQREFVDQAPFMGGRRAYTSLALDSNGNPHIAYAAGSIGDLNLKYAKLVGDQWQVQTIEDNGNVGDQVSLALDSNDWSHIGYRDSRDLKHAFWDGVAWLLQDVDADLDTDGRFSSLAIDGNDNPHIVYVDETNDALKHAYDVGGGWQNEIVDDSFPNGLNPYPSLVIDSGGLPHIAYNWDVNDQIRYARKFTETWQIQAVVDLPNTADTEEQVSLVLDSADNPHITYGHDLINTRLSLEYIAWDGSAWISQTLDNSGRNLARHSSLAIDAAGNPHVSYYDAAYGDLRYVTWAPAWITSTLLDETGLHSPAIVIQNDNPFVGYYDQIGGQVELASWNGSWDFDPLAFVSNSVDQLSIDVGPSQAHVAYYDADNQRLMHARRLGASWQIQIVDEGGDVGRYNDTVLVGAADTLVRIAYWDATNTRVKLASITGSTTELFTNTVGPVLDASSGSLATTVLPSGDSGISYYDGVNGDLRFASVDIDSGLWTDELVDGVFADVGSLNDVRTDGTEGVRVFAYYDATNDAIKFAYEEDGAFQLEVAVPNAGTVTSLELELGLGSRDRPRIAYTTQSNNALYLATKPEGTWQVEIIDSGATLSDVSLDLENRPYLAYLGNSLQYAFSSATFDVNTTLPGTPPAAGPGWYNPLDACKAVLDLLVPTFAQRIGLHDNQHAPKERIDQLQSSDVLEDQAIFSAMNTLFGNSSEGQRYIDLYSQHGSEMGRLGLNDPQLLWDAYGTLQNFLPGLEALVTGRGGEVLVTQDMVDDALDIWQRLAAAGSPGLADVINTELAKYNSLQDFVDLTFDQWSEAIGVPSLDQKIFLPLVIKDRNEP